MSGPFNETTSDHPELYPSPADSGIEDTRTPHWQQQDDRERAADAADYAREQAYEDAHENDEV